jgi:hypothetical protein
MSAPSSAFQFVAVRDRAGPLVAAHDFVISTSQDHAMEPKVIVLITMLSLPNGDSGVNVKPFPSVGTCIEAADIEVTDPFVAGAECAELDDGKLTLNFSREIERPASEHKPKV